MTATKYSAVMIKLVNTRNTCTTSSHTYIHTSIGNIVSDEVTEDKLFSGSVTNIVGKIAQ